MGLENALRLCCENDKIANNSTTTEAKEEINTDLESLEFQNNFDELLAKFRNNLI